MFTVGSGRRVLLIEPPFYKLFGYERFFYPLTLALVGTYLEEMGNEVVIYDADMPDAECRPLNRTEAAERYYLYENALDDNNHPAWGEVRKVIEDFNPDVVGITAISAKIDSANIVAKMVKDFNGNIKTVLGGAHAEGMRVMSPDYDFGSYYDEIVPHIPNLVNRRPNTKLIMDLDKYSPKNLSSIISSTGCPSSCTFCCNSYNRNFVYRDAQSIREEVEDIKSNYGGYPLLSVVSDCFFSNTKHFKEICAVLKEIKIDFEVGTRIKALTEKKIEECMDSGGKRIYVGVESGSQRVLDKVRKVLKVEEIEKRTKWLNDSGMPWSAFFVCGFPFETIEDLKQTRELIYKIRPTFVSINRFTPYPGTAIYEEYYKNSDFKFKELFQLHRHSIAKLPRNVEQYIEDMVVEFDEYNKSMRVKA